jgi:hypothetical protein
MGFAPLLCYYEIKDTLTEVRVQYLVPRQGPSAGGYGVPGPIGGSMSHFSFLY